jgi:uncharacterized protein (DUF1330 family)
MAVYVIAQMRVNDVAKYGEYGAGVMPTIAQYGGRLLVANDIDVKEGSPAYPRTVMGEFPDMESARKWYESSEYQPLIPLRQAATDGVLFMVEGVTMPSEPHKG